MSIRDYQFFYDYAGFSYDPKTETREEGRRRCAMELARAEEKARNSEVWFDWSIDPDFDSSEFDTENEPRELYICKMILDGEILSILGGIDLADNDPYKRVIEAELASEYFD